MGLGVWLIFFCKYAAPMPGSASVPTLAWRSFSKSF
jgi:hypothetical protein